MSKVAVLSYNGSCGKTLIAMHLLLPRMPEAAFFAVETINLSAEDLGAKNVQTLRGQEFGELIEALVLEDEAIIDIGASNIERFFEEMSRFHGATEEIDRFIIPVTPEAKSWQEGAKTAAALARVGIDPSQILLLPNRIERDPADEIPGIFEFVRAENMATVNPDAFLYESEVYTYLNAQRLSFDELLDDDKDYRALAKSAKKADERQKYARLYRWTRQAIPVREHQNAVFGALLPG